MLKKSFYEISGFFFTAEFFGLPETASLWDMVAICIKIDELCIKNDGFCIYNDGLYVLNDAFYTNGQEDAGKVRGLRNEAFILKNDDFLLKNDFFYK